jgi:poly(hydroxyalkanoate) depolymerase family esterase
MNPTFQRLLSQATQLARSSQLMNAGAALSPPPSGGHPPSPSTPPGNQEQVMHAHAASFQNFMAEAGRMTQGGDLQAATAAIQAALAKAGLTGGAAGAFSAFRDDTNVIDVEASEVGRAMPSPQAPVQPAPTIEPGPVAQFVSGSHTVSSAGTRAYKLYIPPASFEDPLPLVLMLHGCTQNPDDFAAGTRMNEAALKRGFYVLYPAQTQHANSSRCWNWFKHNHQKRGRGEPALLAGMTRDVMSRYNIDPQRVYVAGLSAGGAMAAILGDAYPELFAAVGVHSGLPTGSATNLQTALSAMQTGAAPVARTTASPPTIVFHGDRDTTVNAANGEHVVAASAGASQCEEKRARSSNGRDYTHRIYKEAGGRVVAEHWTVHGAGHAWSGGSSRGSYTDATGPDASEEMLRFFLANTLPAKQ